MCARLAAACRPHQFAARTDILVLQSPYSPHNTSVISYLGLAQRASMLCRSDSVQSK